MRAEFLKPDAPDRVVGTARWAGAVALVEAADPETERALRRVFRNTPVAVDDPAERSAGTAGPTVLPPGTLRWFRAVALSRGRGEGFAVRLVPEGRGAMGWDPAGAYRTFVDAGERKERIGREPA